MFYVNFCRIFRELESSSLKLRYYNVGSPIRANKEDKILSKPSSIHLYHYLIDKLKRMSLFSGFFLCLFVLFFSRCWSSYDRADWSDIAVYLRCADWSMVFAACFVYFDSWPSTTERETNLF